jgi:hypothetical protein
MDELSVWIAEHNLKRVDAAEIPMVSYARASEVVNKKTAKFTIDTLVEMLGRIGKRPTWPSVDTVPWSPCENGTVLLRRVRNLGVFEFDCGLGLEFSVIGEHHVIAP